MQIRTKQMRTKQGPTVHIFGEKVGTLQKKTTNRGHW